MTKISNKVIRDTVDEAIQQALAKLEITSPSKKIKKIAKNASKMFTEQIKEEAQKNLKKLKKKITKAGKPRIKKLKK